MTLIGVVPCVHTDPARTRPPPSVTRSHVRLSLPALTTNSQWPSVESVTAPSDPRPAPVPLPPVGTSPPARSEPSPARCRICTALPEVALVDTYTAPWAYAAAGATSTAAAASPIIDTSRRIPVPPESSLTVRAGTIAGPPFANLTAI